MRPTENMRCLRKVCAGIGNVCSWTAFMYWWMIKGLLVAHLLVVLFQLILQGQQQFSNGLVSLGTLLCAAWGTLAILIALTFPLLACVSLFTITPFVCLGGLNEEIASARRVRLASSQARTSAEVQRSSSCHHRAAEQLVRSKAYECCEPCCFRFTVFLVVAPAALCAILFFCGFFISVLGSAWENPMGSFWTCCFVYAPSFLMIAYLVYQSHQPIPEVEEMLVEQDNLDPIESEQTIAGSQSSLHRLGSSIHVSFQHISRLRFQVIGGIVVFGFLVGCIYLLACLSLPLLRPSLAAVGRVHESKKMVSLRLATASISCIAVVGCCIAVAMRCQRAYPGRMDRRDVEMDERQGPRPLIV